MDFLGLLRLGLSLQERATPLQQGLMAPQPSSLRTSFRGLCITRIEIKESVIYAERRQGLVEWEGQNQPEIELNDATVSSCRIKSMENSVQSWHRRLVFFHHLITLFARERNSGASVRPICFAAFKLITNSNCVACCTGKAGGLVPFKILST